MSVSLRKHRSTDLPDIPKTHIVTFEDLRDVLAKISSFYYEEFNDPEIGTLTSYDGPISCRKLRTACMYIQSAYRKLKIVPYVISIDYIKHKGLMRGSGVHFIFDELFAKGKTEEFCMLFDLCCSFGYGNSIPYEYRIVMHSIVTCRDLPIIKDMRILVGIDLCSMHYCGQWFTETCCKMVKWPEMRV